MKERTPSPPSGPPRTGLPRRAGGLVVTTLARPFEWLTAAALSGSFGQRLVNLLLAATGLIHRVVAWVLGWIGALVSRVVGWLPWPCRIALMAAAWLGMAVLLSRVTDEWALARLELSPRQLAILTNGALITSFRTATWGFGLVALLFAPAPLLAFFRFRFVYYYLLLASVVFLALWFVPLTFVLEVPGRLFIAPQSGFDKATRNLWWVTGVALWIPVVFMGVLFFFSLLTRTAREYYFRKPQEQEALGDRVYRNLRTHGGDPIYRTSLYWAGALHFCVLFLYPLAKMYASGAVMAPYAVPKGRGMPTIQGVVVSNARARRTRPRTKTKRIKFVLNMNSAIVFTRPDIDDSRIGEEVEDDTSDTYVASSFNTDGSSGAAGRGRGGGSSGLGAGGPGRGGWPNGMENARVRFIRLTYDGGDWDQEMGANSDYNLLLMFSKYTGFKVAPTTEAIPVNALRRFPGKRAPPFVYITGSGNISVSNEDVKALRWYCTEEWGMIFADNGGGSFNTNFRALMKRVFPELDWVDIANDDVIYRQPFLFPNGAPPLWHHSGGRALGIKFSGRWVVFYHQGDLKDAWKTGHSGVSEAQAMQAYHLGINVMNYAFNQYMAAHFGD
jgi:hypothetical protein